MRFLKFLSRKKASFGVVATLGVEDTYIPLAKGAYKIYRGEDKVIVLEGPRKKDLKILAENHGSVSKKRHLEIIVNEESVRLNDEGSSQGTYLDRKRLTREISLSKPKDYTLQLGGFRLQLYLTGSKL